MGTKNPQTMQGEETEAIDPVTRISLNLAQLKRLVEEDVQQALTAAEARGCGRCREEAAALRAEIELLQKREAGLLEQYDMALVHAHNESGMAHAEIARLRAALEKIKELPVHWAATAAFQIARATLDGEGKEE